MKRNRVLFNSPNKSWGRLAKAAFIAVLVFMGMLEVSAQSREETFVFQPGDQIEVSFPGTPELDRALRIRRDGVATFPLIGEVKVDGLTTAELEQVLKSKYEGQLVANEVMVAVLDSSFSYYVEGAVNAPGKIISFRALTVLEAVLEAGGYSEIAKIEVVKVIRRKAGKYEFYKVNLKKVLDGKSDESFSLEPNDIVSVPEKFW